MYVYWEITRTPFDADTNTYDTGNTEVISGYKSPTLSKSLGSNRDTFSLEFKNINNEGFTKFNLNDKLSVRRSFNTTTTSESDTLMTAVVRDDALKITESSNKVIVECYNFTSTIMEAIVFIDPRTQSIPDGLELALNHVKQYNSNFAVEWNTNNPSTKSDGSAFPNMDQRFYNKPIRKLFEKYSTNSSTEDGTYYYFVDKNNEMVWKKREKNINYTFNVNTDDHISFDDGKNIDQVKNFIIIKGGFDPNNKPLQNRYADYSSINKHGMKYKLLVDENKYGQNILEQDRIQEGVDDMEDATYPLTPSWDSSITASDYNDYVTEFRAHVKQHLKELAMEYVEQRKYGRYEASIEVRAGTKSWGLGDNISLTTPRYSTGKLLRVEEIQYASDSDKFTLVEDEGTL